MKFSISKMDSFQIRSRMLFPVENVTFSQSALFSSTHLYTITLLCPSEKSYRWSPRGAPTVGVPTYLPPLKTIFPVEFMHTNCTIYHFKMAAIFENFRFVSLRNTPKFEEPLSQKSFLTKFGPK